MLKLKDTGKLNKDIKSTITGNIIGNKGNLVLIEKWTDKRHLIVTDTVTRQMFKIHDSNIIIDYPDVSKANIELLCSEGWTEKQLTKYVD